MMVGCSSSASIPTWQKSLEQYVRTDGRGDPSILRTMTIEGGRPGFAVIGEDDPHNSTDAKGLLLAHKQVEGKPWFIYLVGLVNKQQVSSLQLAALNVQGGKFHWAMGKPDANALKAYRNYHEEIGKQRSGQAKAPVTYMGFPNEGDVFEVGVEQNRVDALHQQSGARWEVLVK